MTALGEADGAEAGLTLIEMIVALALGAVVVSFLAQGTGLLRSFARLGATISAQDETLAVRDHLRQTLAATLGPGSGSLRRGNFAGVDGTAVFTVPGDRLLETGAPVRVTLAALPDGQRLSLVETRAPASGAGGNDPSQRTRRLVEGATAVRFSYSGGPTDEWVADWTDPEVTPRLMRIEVAFPPGDGRRWPPFVALMPTGSPAVAEAAPDAPSPKLGAR